MPEGPIGVDRGKSATALRQPTPSSAIYPRLHSGSLQPSRPKSTGALGSRVTSSASRRTISRTGSSRRSRNRKDGANSGEAEGKGGVDGLGGAKLSDRLDSDVVDIYNDYGWDTDLETEPTNGGEESDVFEGRDSSNGGPTLQIYLDACKKDGVTPASYFLRHVADEYLSMKHHSLGCVRVKPLATALASSAIVLSLDLEDNWLEEEGGVVLCGMLKENSYIAELDLSNNRLGAAFARCFADVVLSNSTLTSVTLSGNLLDENAAEFLAEAISGSGALEYLDLSKNRLGDAAGILLGPAIADNCSLKHLNLSFNSLRNRGAAAVAVGLKNNVLLKSVDLSWNGFAATGSKALGDALRVNTTLEELDITNNRLTVEAAAFISKGLEVNEALKTLKIGKNPLKSAGCLTICNALLKNPNTSIRRLDFTDISVDEDVKKLLTQLHERNPDLSFVTEVDPLADSGRGFVGVRRGLAAHPVARLRSYLEAAGLDAVELFTSGRRPGGLATPPRTVIDKDQFCDIVKSLEQLAFNENDLDELVDALTVKGRDLVDYSELIATERPLSYYAAAGSATGTSAGTAAGMTAGTIDETNVGRSTVLSANSHRTSSSLSSGGESRDQKSAGARSRGGSGHRDPVSREGGKVSVVGRSDVTEENDDHLNQEYDNNDDMSNQSDNGNEQDEADDEDDNM